jgi:Repeat of unknown function (DUF5648)
MNRRTTDASARPTAARGRRTRLVAGVVAATVLSIGLSASVASADTATFLDAVGEPGTTPVLDIARYRVSLDATTFTSTLYFAAWDRAALDTAHLTTVLSIDEQGRGDFAIQKAAGGATAILTNDASPAALPGCPVTVTYTAAEQSMSFSVSAACLGTPAVVSAYHSLDTGTFFDYADSNPFGPSRPVGNGPDSGLQLPVVTVQRFWSQAFNNAHFFTADSDEAGNIIDNDKNWAYEGVAFGAYAADAQGCSSQGLSAVYRFYSPRFQSHFFTSSADEKDSIRAHDANWTYEGVAYCAPSTADASTTPLYRFWSPRFGKHFYTASGAEANQLRTSDPNWTYEGLAYNVLP